MAPLSMLPAFFDLRGKRVVICGGSAAAAWKAELVAAAGARIEVWSAPDALAPEMCDLLAGGRPDIRLIGSGWRDCDFQGAALAIADARDDSDAESFAATAQLAGVPCNVIDRPQYCSVMFGSIVNRSPVVVGILSGGTAPILSQEIRRRIEAVLPSTVSAWAALAGRIRSRVNAALKPGLARRAFWEALCERAFVVPPPEDDVAFGFLSDRAHRQSRSGQVTIVERGHLDAEHLTLKTLRELMAADVVLFDNDVSETVLELARREARRIAVDGRSGLVDGETADAALTAAAIAREGKRVVRIIGLAGKEWRRG